MIMKYRDFKILSVDDMKQIMGGNPPGSPCSSGECGPETATVKGTCFANYEGEEVTCCGCTIDGGPEDECDGA